MKTRNRSVSEPHCQYGPRKDSIGHGSTECGLDNTEIWHRDDDRWETLRRNNRALLSGGTIKRKRSTGRAWGRVRFPLQLLFPHDAMILVRFTCFHVQHPL